MGRPPMNLEETKVRLNVGMKERIIALVGEQRMSAYVRETLEARLQKDEAAAKLKPDKGATEGERT